MRQGSRSPKRYREHEMPPNFRQVLECDRPCGAFPVVRATYNSEMRFGMNKRPLPFRRLTAIPNFEMSH